MESTNRCPNCGGTLQLSKNRKSMICAYCDSEFLLNRPEASATEAPNAGASILDPDRFNLLWDYERLSNFNKDVSESLRTLIYCTDELVTSDEIEKYIRDRLLDDSEVAGSGFNEDILSGLKARLSPDFLPDERIIAYGNTGIFSKGKDGIVVTNDKTFFVSKKKYTFLRHQDIHSIRVEVGMKLPSYYLNGKFDYYLSSMGSHFRLQGAMMALALAYAWEEDPDRDRIEITSKC